MPIATYLLLDMMQAFYLSEQHHNTLNKAAGAGFQFLSRMPVAFHHRWAPEPLDCCSPASCTAMGRNALATAWIQNDIKNKENIRAIKQLLTQGLAPDTALS